MTREEAIKILKAIRVYECYPKSASEETKEAIDMAIEELTQDSRKVTQESTHDLISRADAIKAIRKCKFESTMPTDWYQGMETAQDIVNKVPSAEVVKGEWIDIDSYYRMATCSHCLKVTMFEKWGEYTRPYNYCPNCGAKMRI